jgi:hypothetical protein
MAIFKYQREIGGQTDRRLDLPIAAHSGTAVAILNCRIYE